MEKKTVIAQEDMLSILLPLMEQTGEIHQKQTNIFARQAKGGEQVETVTSDGKETVNEAQKGDFLVRNQTEAGEMYIIPGEKFHDKYQFLQETGEGFSEYRSLGKVLALELSAATLEALELNTPFYFEAHWGEKMVAKEGDYLAMPLDKSEVYRIARKEFFETYV